MANLFSVRGDNERELLDKTRSRALYHAVVQVLFTGIRCRKDTQTSIAFLTTRVRKPDENDWNKVRRLLKYLKIIIKLPLIMLSEGVTVLKWWVDASYLMTT